MSTEKHGPAAYATAADAESPREAATEYDLGPTRDDLPELLCVARVHRIGEIFAEFGFQCTHEKAADKSNPVQVSQWHLVVTNEAHETVFDGILQTKDCVSKVVKVKAASAFLVKTRVYSDLHECWGPWSAPARTRSFPPVLSRVDELGEDYVRISWDRQLRDTSLIDAELFPESQEPVAQISQFQLRVVREIDMQQEFFEEFPVGSRTYTLYDLRPATAYIVFVRYATLIGTLKQWSEVCRFVTQATHDVQLSSRGEDQFTVHWERPPLPQKVGYIARDATIHKFELTLEGGSSLPEPLDLPASCRSYTFASLLPSTQYKVRFRCLTKEGRWTAKTKPLVVQTADRPDVEIEAVGEHFVTVSWQRANDEVDERVEVEVSNREGTFSKTHTVTLEDWESKNRISCPGLTHGHEYVLRLRSRLHECDGLWSDPISFQTRRAPILRLTERGEDFLTVNWDIARNLLDTEKRWYLHVTRVAPNGDRQVILEAEAPESPDGCRVGDLSPNSTYEIKVRGWEHNALTGSENWGEYSVSVTGHTLRSIALQLADLGEDFAEVVWTRKVHDPSTAEAATEGEVQQWGDLKYEVALGSPETGDDHLLHREVLETSYTLSNLMPDTTYIVSVRACDERGQWGQWRTTRFRTLSNVVLIGHEVGEDYARVMWKRNQEIIDDDDETDRLNALVSQYVLLVFSNDNGGSAAEQTPCPDTGYAKGGDSEFRVVKTIANQHTSIRLSDLAPDRTYTAVLRARTLSGKWGLWSAELRFRTVAPFRIDSSNLNIGENYVIVEWHRDEHPAVDASVMLGDYTVTQAQIRVTGVDTAFNSELPLAPEQRQLKYDKLAPATAYSIQIRACNKSGEWGQWSSPAHILTRATIVTRAVEVAEDYIVLAWEKKRAANPRGFPTGKGFVSGYRLRVADRTGVKVEESLIDADCPYKITNLEPNSFHKVELRAYYNEEEWGAWSAPLWCLTMMQLEVKNVLVSEEFCKVRIVRPKQDWNRSPKDDGFPDPDDDATFAHGSQRPQMVLCVTTPHTTKTLHTSHAAKAKAKAVSARVPPACTDERLILEHELADDDYTITGLKCDQVYSVSARSRREGGEWGMWSETHRFITLSPIKLSFSSIGEDYIVVDWRRAPQEVPHASILKGHGSISRSRLKFRELNAARPEVIEIDSPDTEKPLEGLDPATTYVVSVQTFNDNHDWGVWSDETRVRTMAPLGVFVEHVGEDAVWLSWMRMGDMGTDITADTALSADTNERMYRLLMVGEGNTFRDERDIEKDPSIDGGNCFYRGLMPDSVYHVSICSQSKNKRWGKMTKKQFHTLPSMRVTFGNVGEHFAVVEWRRHLPTGIRGQAAALATGANEIVAPTDVISKFRLKVQLGKDKPTVFELSPHVSSYTLQDLKPSAEYRVWLCANGREGVWGVWSNETRVRTLPQLALVVDDIGEDYVSVSWRRQPWHGSSLETAEDVKIWEVESAVASYKVRVCNAAGELVREEALSFKDSKCTLEKLDPHSLYSVSVCAKDTYGEWGLWCDAQRFVTLDTVETNLIRIGEDFVSLEWDRRFNMQYVHSSEADDDSVLPLDPEAVEEDAEASAPGSPASPRTPTRTESPVAEEPIFDADVLRGDEVVRKWQIRLYSSTIYGGLPGASDFQEFTKEADEMTFDIGGLRPNASYTVVVRAMNASNTWGPWSETKEFHTLPLIKPELTYIGEDFMTLAWSRPTIEADGTGNTAEHDLHCFPQPHAAVHNYQVFIVPYDNKEAQFDPKDEPLVDGGRQYETSQPQLKLRNLTAGTRYRVLVREQRIDFQGNLELDNFGVYCETLIVETIERMGVTPTDISEHGAVLQWRRERRQGADEVTAGDSAIRSNAKVTSYELHAFRMDEAAKGPLPKGDPQAMFTHMNFPVSVTHFDLQNLTPDTIYGVSVRSQTEGGHWGQWSPPTKFVTLKKLQTTVELANEEGFVLSWQRAMPDWVQATIPRGPISDGGDALTAVDEETNDGASELGVVVNVIGIPVTAIDPNLTSVVTGEYTVRSFEIVVEGLGHDYEQRIELPAHRFSFTVTGLTPNRIYSAKVRSLSNTEQWSVFSPPVSVCTLKRLEVGFGKVTEHFVYAHWHRPEQNINDYAKALEKKKIEIKRVFDKKEKEMRIRQLHLTEAKAEMDPVEAADDIARLQVELDTIGLEMHLHQRGFDDEIQHLQIENVHMGKAEATAYQVRLFGEDGFPRIDGYSHMLEPKTARGNRMALGAALIQPVPATRSAVSGMLPPKPPGGAASTRMSSVGRKRGTPTDVGGRESTPGTAPIPTEASDGEEDGLMLDVKVNRITHEVCIQGLEPACFYEIEVRHRNVVNEWGPWTKRCDTKTPDLIKLNRGRIGENYVNLFWHRLPKEVQAEQEKEALAVARWEEDNKHITPADMERMKATMKPEAYQQWTKEFKEWKHRAKDVAKALLSLHEGQGDVVVPANSAIQGYYLRIVFENGATESRYFPADTLHQFTWSGLTPNSLYVVLLCADYGDGEWGRWSEPVKFMTQNLMQLSINYVSETFVDIEWRRAPNKKVPRNEENVITVTSVVQGPDTQYEVRTKFVETATGAERDETHKVTGINFFRIANLRPDTRYDIWVRECDANAQWGLWSTAKACHTMPRMKVDVGEVGEHWVSLKWDRLPSQLPRPDLDATLIDLPVENMAYYLRIMELDDNGTPEDLARIQRSEAAAVDAAEGEDPEGSESDDDDLFDMLATQRTQLAPGSALPPAPPPTECEPKPGQRYMLVRKFSYDETEFRCDDLNPNRFYSLQVLCETTGAQIGHWSTDVVVITHPKITVRAALVDEECARLTWEREAPRHHPRLSGVQIVQGNYECDQYEMVLTDIESNGQVTSFQRTFNPHEHECKVDKLMLHTAYRVRMRSADTQGRISLWSDNLHFATLTRMRIVPTRIAEQVAWVEWSREPQIVEDFPFAASLDTPLKLPVDKSNQYHLTVHEASGSSAPVLNKVFTGQTSRFQLSNLTPNTAYTLSVRACNVFGEWGQDSRARVMYTMKLPEVTVQAVGEHYIVVSWHRDAPDELPDMMRVEAPKRDEYDEDEDGTTRMQMVRKFPLLDKPVPAEGGPDLANRAVYCSERTTITRYCISVQKHDEADPQLTEINASADGSSVNYQIRNLLPDSQYVICIRARYGNDEWGAWSEICHTGTLNLLITGVKQVGEDYASVFWSRAHNTFSFGEGAQRGQDEETLAYEFVVHDYTQVAVGDEEKVAEQDAVIGHGITARSDEEAGESDGPPPPPLVLRQKTAKDNRQLFVKSLQPNRRYRLGVRRWYKPVGTGKAITVEESSVEPTEEGAAPSEDRLDKYVSHNGGAPGEWSEAVFVLTLKEMVVTAEDIAEDFMHVRWERDPSAAQLPTRGCVKVTPVVQTYHVRIDELVPDGTSQNVAPGSLHFDQQFAPDDAAFRITELKPDTAYQIEVRCCCDRMWGLWSKACVAVTLPKITVTINAIGEDYVTVNWERKLRQLTMPDGTQALTGHSGNLERYHLEMYGLEHPFHFEKKFKPTRTSYRAKHLEAQMMYSIRVRSCDSSNLQSLWSDRVSFVTLKPLQLTFGKVGEQFVHVNWARDPQTPDEYPSDANVQLGDPNVSSFHLCVFEMDNAPTTAIVDRQFGGDVTHYRITRLKPSTSYVVIVRACNPDGQWGFWSEEKLVSTLKVIQLSIVSVGENYVLVKWTRDDSLLQEEGAMLNPNLPKPQGIRVDPTLYHIGVTGGDRAAIDKYFTLEEAAVEGSTPMYCVRGLIPDTSYVVTLQACYNDDEWGLWTTPQTFLTLNKLGILVSNITEDKADFTWGRAQQSPQHAYDPNIVVHHCTVIRYQLVIRTLEAFQRSEELKRQQATLGAGDADGGKVSLPPISGAAEGAEATGTDDADTCIIEREMDARHKYIQTFCVADRLSVNTDYHVQIRALDDRNEWGEWSQTVFDTPPNNPGRPTLKKVGNSQVLFTWDPPDGKSRYMYCVEQAVVKDARTKGKSAAPVGNLDQLDWRVVDTVEEPQCRIKAPHLNKIRCRVKCCKIDREIHLWSKYSAIAAVSSALPPEPVPSLRVSTLSRTSATVEWGRSPSAQVEVAPAEGAASPGNTSPTSPSASKIHYRVLIADRDQQQMRTLNHTRNTSYEITDLLPNTAYRVSIQVEVEGGGLSSQKNLILKFTTKADNDRSGNAVPKSMAGVVRADSATAEDAEKLPALGRAGTHGSSRADRVDVSYTPKPPEKERGDQAPSTARRPQPTGKPGTAPAAKPQKPGTAPPKKQPRPPPSTAKAPPPAPEQLPPVSERPGPPPQGAPHTAVEQFDVVAFAPSEDGEVAPP